MRTYEDIFGPLTKEEKEMMIKADIPVFEPTGEKIPLTEEEKKEAKESLRRLMKEFGAI